MVSVLTESIQFPPTATARWDGLLAVGGDLSPERLWLAYRSGIFPWFMDDRRIEWYSPPERFVLFPTKLKFSRSLRQVLKSQRFRVTVDTAFELVIRNCAAAPRPGQGGETWITSGMIAAYTQLHQQGRARSVEVWKGEQLAGGLYGIDVGRVFCGESMFSRESNASKVALAYLVRKFDYSLIDCQVYTPHLESLGAELIPRSEYEAFLKETLSDVDAFKSLRP